FNACESATCNPALANYDRLFTKVTGQGFDVYMLALKNDGTLANTFASTVAVDLLANTNVTAGGVNNCPASQTATISLGNVSFAAGRGSVLNTTVNSAYRDV